MKTLRDFLFWAIVPAVVFYFFMVATNAFPQASLPPRDNVTVQDLKALYGECQAALSGENKYEQKLVDRIQLLEKENEDLRKKVDASANHK